MVCRAEGPVTLTFAKPLTFMNRSGLAVGALLDQLELNPDAIVVVVDDIDLPLGRLRLRSAGGPGTHNGLRDVVSAVGPDFARLRVGVFGGEVAGDLAEYVLSDFSAEEQDAVSATIARAADAVEAVLAEGFAPAMNRFNRPVPSTEPASE